MSDQSSNSSDRNDSHNSGRRSRSHIRSRRVSSIEQENEKLSISASEIDELIENWNDVKRQIKDLEEKEKKYKRLMARIMDVTKAEVIKGKDLSVTRKIQKRRFLNRADLPSEIFDEYSITKEIAFYYIRDL